MFRHLLIALIWFALCPVSASATDLTKIDRTIAKEPSYQAKPRYCLLVFGPDAKHRVWLVFDEDTLCVDTNGNGDLTEAGEQVKSIKNDGTFIGQGAPRDPLAKNRYFALQELREAEGKARHTRIRIWRTFAADGREDFGVSMLLRGELQRYQQAGGRYAQLSLGDSPKDAPVLHFDGPLTFGLSFPPQPFVRGKLNHLAVGVGSAGLGKNAFTFLTNAAIPPGLNATAEIEFAGKSAAAMPIKISVAMGERAPGSPH